MAVDDATGVVVAAVTVSIVGDETSSRTVNRRFDVMNELLHDDFTLEGT